MELDENKNNEQQNLENNLEQNANLENSEVTVESQNSFLQSTLGKVINTAADVGLRALLPDILEDQLIEIKDSIINNGFKEGINTAINSAIDLGKSAIGIFTGKFENISQAQTAIKKGGILDGVSSTIDSVLKSSTKSGLIDKKVSNLIKKGKNVIIDTVESNIEEEFFNQMKGVEKIGKYTQNWNNYYQNKDLTGMEREYKKIKKQLVETMPLEETLTEARKIENIHTLVKNKNSFELTEEELQLAEKLI